MEDLAPLLAVSDTVWQALIAACVTIILGYMQYTTQKKLGDVSNDIAVVHTNTNSLVEKLILATSEEAHARGEQDERDRQRDED